MKVSADYKTICEVLRRINDCCQGNTENDAKIRELLLEAMSRAKNIITDLWRYKKACDREWWKKNPQAEIDLLKGLRTGMNYKIGGKIKEKDIYKNKNIHEILGEISILCNENMGQDSKIQELLSISINMAKRMTAKLEEYESKK